MKAQSTLLSFWLPRFAFLIAVVILGWALINIRLLIQQDRASAPAGRGAPPAEAPTRTPEAGRFRRYNFCAERAVPKETWERLTTQREKNMIENSNP